VFSKIECQLYSRTALNVFVTIDDQKAADKLVGVCDVKLMNKGQNKSTHIKNLRLDFCQLKKHTDTRSLLGAYYQAIRRAVVNFPDKCPFQKVSVISFSDLRYFLINFTSFQNTTYFVNRFNFIGQDIPQYLPEANYTFTGKIYANNKLGLEVKLTGGYYEVRNLSVYTKPLL